MTAHLELLEIAETLEAALGRLKSSEVQNALRARQAIGQKLQNAWSGSSLGYHACVYYDDFEGPPPGAHFSSEWGMGDHWPIEGSTGEWREYRYSDIIELIRHASDLTDAMRSAAEVKNIF